MQWFNVDRQGLAKLLERRGKSFIIWELVQNALDEQTSLVDVRLERIPGTRRVRLVVEDDNPTGFQDLDHAYTLFAESKKKGLAEKRGRFNLGDKLCLALCDEAEISSTKGTIHFSEKGRVRSRKKRDRGSRIECVLKMTDAEMDECEQAIMQILPPADVTIRFNGNLVPSRTPLAEFEAVLATEIADGDGVLRRTQRKTCVRIIEPIEDETPMLYELGIPVVAAGDLPWHIDVAQKLPLNMERNGVNPAYLSRIHALVLQHMESRLSTQDANATWVKDAMERHGEDLPDTVVQKIMGLRFGEKIVAFDPSDREANHRAVAAGYTVIHGGQLSAAEWSAVRRSGTALPAGRVTPSPKPFSNDPNASHLRMLDEEKWTPAIKAVVAYAERIGGRLLGCPITVSIANDVTWPFAGAYGAGRLTLNHGRLGRAWFERADLVELNSLLIHEFGHHYSGNHLSASYHEALTRLGGKLCQLALQETELFNLSKAETS